MTQVSIRNRNANNPDKNPNFEYRFPTAKVGEKQKSISKCGFKTKQEAYEAGIKALNEYLNTGKVFKPTNMSVADCCDLWLEEYVDVNLSYKTIDAYTRKIDKYIKPALGKYHLKYIDTLTLQNFINNLCLEGRLSRVYIKSIMKVVKAIFKFAKVKANLIKDNPAENIEMPRGTTKKEDYHILSINEIETILNRFKNIPYLYYPILVSYYTGLRVSEVYALSWDDIDFENKTIRVAKAVNRMQTEKSLRKPKCQNSKTRTRWYITPCKSNSSYRTIKVGKSLLDGLKYYRQIQESNRIEYGDLYTNHYLKKETYGANRVVYRIISIDDETGLDLNLPKINFVFVKEDGGFYGTDGMKYASKIINKELGIEFKFRALRHTHATRLVENGAPMKDVQERLGHSSLAVTMETYVSNTPKMREKTACIFEETSSLDLNKENIRLFEKPMFELPKNA